jgi:hypothetical protein
MEKENLKISKLNCENLGVKKQQLRHPKTHHIEAD